MQLFFSQIKDGSLITLDENDSRHCIKTLRKNVGDTVYVTNGNGYLFETIIKDDHHKKCKLEILNESFTPALFDFNVEIAIAPTKNIDRTEWFVEKACELGINTISFLLCDQSERKIIKLERLNKIAISAMKQSKQVHLPTLNNMVKFSDFVEKQGNKSLFIPHLVQDLKREPLISSLPTAPIDVCVLIGPEGDFSKNEVELAIKKGAKPITLGPTVLRTETAGIYTASLLVNHFSLL